MAEIDTSRRVPRIVVLGGGFAGAYCAQGLERLLRSGEAEVVLIDRNNYFLFYPLLVEAGTGSLEPRHAVVSIRAFLRRTRFVMGEVTDLDPQARRVRYRLAGAGDSLTMEYDHLVVTLGSVTHLPPVPGLAEHGFEMKNLSDAVRLRDHAIRQLERADAEDDPEIRRRLLHFVVVGANFTGVEVVGEFDVFLARARREYSNIDARDVTLTLVELNRRILPALDEELAAYAVDRLQRRGIHLELETSIDQVEKDRATLSDGRVLPTETVIWCAGIAPPPLLRKLPLPVDTRGYLECERDLRVKGFDHLWAIGDSASNPGPDGVPYPATAQHAVQQGKHAARNIVRTLRGRAATPCNIRSRGALAALGCRTAVAKVFGVKLSGFPAWFLWRTVYLMKMPGWSRRLRVALDWTVDIFFPRDSVQLGLTSGGRGSQAADQSR